MNCTKCGAPLQDGDKFCEVCGTPAENATTEENNAQQPVFQEPTFQQQPFNNEPQMGGIPPMQQGVMNSFDVNAGFNTKRIRKWFNGNKPKWPVVLTVLSVILWIVIYQIKINDYNYYYYDRRVSLFNGNFVVALIFGIIWAVTWMTSGTVQEVNDAWRTYVNILSQRGLHKLNLIQEEVNLIDPVVLVGCGEKPNDSFAVSKAQEVARVNIFRLLFHFITGKLKKEYDPEEKYRIDSQDYFHSMLLQVSVYMFSGEQVFGYFGNIDTSTGLIYKEYTSEVFFEDINAVNLTQEVLKVYSARRKKRVNKVVESFVLYLAGCNLMSSVLLEANDKSVVDQQLTGMRNLIRDKKKSNS